MSIFYKSLGFGKKLLTAAACISLCTVQDAAAQVTVTISSTTPNITTGFPNPYPDTYEAARQQYLYLASELKAAGMSEGRIVGVGFETTAGKPGIDNARIYMGMTTATSLNNTTWEPTSQVWSQKVFGGLVGWTMYNFDMAASPGPQPGINWDGVSNVVVEICQDNPSRGPIPGLVNYMTTSFNSSHSSAQNNGGSGCGATNLSTQGTPTHRPNTQFSYLPMCLPPDSVYVTNITHNSADISLAPSQTPFAAVLTLNHRVLTTSATPTAWNDQPPPATPPNFTDLADMILLPETKYYVHAFTRCDVKQAVNQYSEAIIDSFTTVANCVPPVVTVDRVTFKDAVASWPPVPTAYDYEYAVSVETTPPTAGTRTQSTAVLLQGLMYEQRYNVFVRAYCTPTPLSRWSMATFTTGKFTGIEETEKNGFAIKSYPNPVKNTLTVELTKPAANAAMQVTDLTGKVVFKTNFQNNKASISTEGLAPGIYIIKYTDSDRSKMLKIVKE